MAKKAVLTALALLIIHAIFIWQTSISGGQYSWQNNAMKAQQYIYDDKTPPNVIIGSSLANRLNMDNLANMYNLSFAGLGIFDGLAILRTKRALPKNVFVEMNIPQREENKKFTSYINSPILSPLKRYIPSLRDGHQPVSVFETTLINSLKKNQSDPKANESHGEGVHDDVFDKLLAIEVINYSEIPDKDLFKERFDELQRDVSALEKRGVNVIFFEMPVNAKICNLPRPRTIRSYFHKYFPATTYSYIPMPDCGDYKTTDGAHLTDEEAVRYTNYLKLKIDPLVSKSR
jgi:hypothetical protein